MSGPKLSQFKLLHGLILPQLAAKLNLYVDNDTCDELKDMFKKYFRIGRTRDLTEREMSRFISQINMISAREFGIFLKDPSDPENADEMTLGEYLEHKQQQNERIRYTENKEAKA
jgi:hypothetical protein